MGKKLTLDEWEKVYGDAMVSNEEFLTGTPRKKSSKKKINLRKKLRS